MCCTASCSRILMSNGMPAQGAVVQIGSGRRLAVSLRPVCGRSFRAGATPPGHCCWQLPSAQATETGRNCQWAAIDTRLAGAGDEQPAGVLVKARRPALNRLAGCLAGVLPHRLVLLRHADAAEVYSLRACRDWRRTR